MSPSSSSKKRKISSTTKTSKADRTALQKEVDYEPPTLTVIYNAIMDLSRQVPDVPTVAEEEDTTTSNNENNNNGGATDTTNKEKLRQFASDLQDVLEAFHIHVAGVSNATYQWATDRSGAAEQNLSLLTAEMAKSQEQLLGRVAPRLTDVLCPVVSIQLDKTITTKKQDDDSGEEKAKEEIKQHYYKSFVEDPDYLDLSYQLLRKNASHLRLLVLSCFDRSLQAISDFQAAQHKDSQHDSRGFVY